MSDILERAKQHFAAKLSGEMGCVEVPEWSEDPNNPLKIYWRPMSLADRNKIYKYVQEGSLESMAEMLILRARDADGNRLFRPVHKTELMRHVDPDVISRICEAMSGEMEAVDDVEKK